MGDSHHSTLKTRMRSGETLLGTWSMLSSANAVEVIGASGMQFVVIDMEHGSMSFETVENMVRAAEVTGCSPIVRVSDGSEATILRALETEPEGIMVPHVEDAALARRIVKACRYFPDGERGLSPYTRVHGFSHEGLAESMRRSNERLAVGVLVEGKEGIANIEDIARVPGLDLVYLGSYDISQSVGLPGQLTHPSVVDAMKHCAAVIRSAGVAAGSFAADVAQARMLREYHFNFVAYLADSAAMRQHYADAVSEWRNAGCAGSAEGR